MCHLQIPIICYVLFVEDFFISVSVWFYIRLYDITLAFIVWFFKTFWAWSICEFIIFLSSSVYGSNCWVCFLAKPPFKFSLKQRSLCSKFSGLNPFTFSINFITFLISATGFSFRSSKNTRWKGSLLSRMTSNRDFQSFCFFA